MALLAIESLVDNITRLFQRIRQLPIEILIILDHQYAHIPALPDFAEQRTSSLLRNSGRKTATHFCWNCLLLLPQFRTQNRYTLLLELL
jgi:hypothetical protein